MIEQKLFLKTVDINSDIGEIEKEKEIQKKNIVIHQKKGGITKTKALGFLLKLI
jgi:hypothetical protein